MLSNVKHIILNITDDCNLQCKYCFVNFQKTYINFSLCKQIIDLLLLNNINREITFFGGEPLMLWDKIIVPTIEYSKKNNAKINFNITTNGTLLDEKKLIYLKENNVSLLLSMDGNKETQNFNRPLKDGKGSFFLLEKKIDLIKKYLPNTVIRATLFPQTSNFLYENFLYFKSLGFQYCTFCPDEFSDWDDNKINDIKENLQKISSDYLTNKNSNIKFLPYEDMLDIIKEGKNFVYNYKQCNTCGLNFENKIICINYEGKIFSCQELSSYNQLKNNPYEIGNIFSGINIKQKENLLKNYMEHTINCNDTKYCNQCRIKNICSLKFCHANSFLKFQNLYTKSKIICIWQNLIYSECERMLFEYLKKINNKKRIDDINEFKKFNI